MAFSTIASRINVFDRLNSFRERFGIKGTLYKSLDVVLHKVFRTYIHTVVWLDLKPVAKMACSDPQFTFRFLTADEIANVREGPELLHRPVAGRRRAKRARSVLRGAGGRSASRLRLLHAGIRPAGTVRWRGDVVSDRRGLHVVRLHASRFSRSPTARAHHGTCTPGTGEARRYEAGVDRGLDELGVAQELLPPGLPQPGQHDHDRRAEARRRHVSKSGATAGRAVRPQSGEACLAGCGHEF